MSENVKKALIKSLINGIILLIDLVAIGLVAFFAFTKYIRPGEFINIVSGSSMTPNYHNGQLLFADTKEIERGDCVILSLQDDSDVEEAHRNHCLFKRVIGLPGDTVKILVDGTVEINGEVLDESYLSDEVKRQTYIIDGYHTMTLGPNEYFVMGDNRGASYDSRYCGTISAEQIRCVQSTSPTFHTYLVIVLLICVMLLAFTIIQLFDKLAENIAHKVFNLNLAE